MDQLATPHAMDSPITLPWWRKRRTIQAAVAVLVLLLVSFSAWLLLGSPERTLRLETGKLTIAEVQKTQFHDFIPLRASVVAMNTVYLDALEGGRVERI